MSLNEKFKSFLASNDFSQLTHYMDPVSWGPMSNDDRELLAMLFLKQGELQLIQGDNKVLHSFELASKIAPQSTLIHYTQGAIFAEKGENVRCLSEACKAFEKVTELDPQYYDAWDCWGNMLIRLGQINDNIADFYCADDKFMQIERLQFHENDSKILGKVYWQRAMCWLHIGRHSGEASDYSRSVELFRIAEEKDSSHPDFYRNFGSALYELGTLLGRKELFEEACIYFRKYTKMASNVLDGWLNLAACCQRLFEYSCEAHYFSEADEAYERAIELNNEDPNIWLGWGELYINTGKAIKDIERIQSSLEKFDMALTLDKHSPNALLFWGEAHMLIATHTEDLELLREAERKIRTATDQDRENPDAWYIHGVCLSELGRYFHDEKYYYQAIEKFQLGLSLNPNSILLMHGMSMAHFFIGDITNDHQMVEQSTRLCSRMNEIEPNLPSQFLNDWGVAYMRLGEITGEKIHIEAAAEKFEQAISLRIESKRGEEVEVEWLYNYGCSMDFLGDFHEEPLYYEKAIQVFSHLVKNDPEHQLARYHLALALFHLGELNGDLESLHQAVDLFHELIEQDPEDEMAWNDYGLTLLHLAVLTYEPATQGGSQALFEQAESKFQQAVALGNMHAFYNLACLYALMNNPTAAVHYLERADNCGTLPSIIDVMHDEWLEGIQNDPLYRQFISRLISDRKDNPELD